jgi:hypothetical protein
MNLNFLLKASVTAALLIGSAGALADGTSNFGSDIVTHSDQYPANPIAIHLTTQGGSVYGYSSIDSGWGFYTDRPDWYVSGFDDYGIQEGTYGHCGGGNCYPTGYVGLTMTAPNTVVGLTAAAKAATMNTSDAKYMLIKMANEQGGPWTGAGVVTVVLSNGKNSNVAYTDPHADATATAVCSSDVTLATIGDGMPVGPDFPGNREHGMFTYKVNMASFKCSKGNLIKALSALTAVSIEIRNDKNATGLYADYTATGGNIEWLSISRVSFGK